MKSMKLLRFSSRPSQGSTRSCRLGDTSGAQTFNINRVEQDGQGLRLSAHSRKLPWKKAPGTLLLLLCSNLILANAVQAATGDALSRSQSYALGLLGLVVVALAVYLFVVMFQPERF